MTKPISIYKMKGKVKKINLKPPPRKWLAVLPRRKIQGDKKSKAVRPNQMEKTPYGRISPPGEEKTKKFQKILKNFKKLPSYTTYYAERSFLIKIARKTQRSLKYSGEKWNDTCIVIKQELYTKLQQSCTSAICEARLFHATVQPKCCASQRQKNTK